MNETYLLKGVKPQEFVKLKRQETDLVGSVIEGFNDDWKQKVQGVKTTLRYNIQRNAIGIYVERDGQQKLVVERQGLNEPEEALVRSLYQTLEQRLDGLRLPQRKLG